MTRSEAINILRDAASRIELAEWSPSKLKTVEDLLRHYALITDPFHPWQQVSFDLLLAIRQAWAPSVSDAMPLDITAPVFLAAMAPEEAAAKYLRDSAQQLTRKS